MMTEEGSVKDTLDYLDKLNLKLSRLNRSVTTEVRVDEDKIMRRIEEKLKRQFAGRTRESNGV